MKVLFIHQNFPGQFANLAADLARDRRNSVVALTIDERPAPAGVQVRPYKLLRAPVQDTHPLLREQESKVLRAEACAAAAMQLRRDGFVPDVIVAHPGWGEALFIKDVFPEARLVVYCEYYYALEGQDVGFDPEVPPLTFFQKCLLRLKNTTSLLSMEIADAGISPTQWQKSTFPAWAQEKISVIHDGIDLKRLRRQADTRLVMSAADGRRLTIGADDKVITYVARNLEPIRGFQIFMRTLPRVLSKHPDAQALVIGGDDVGYGHPAPGGLTWRQHLLSEVGDALDRSRVHFLGKVPYDTYIDVLNVSRAHAYWTAPFVLSWSFLEASMAGVPVVASDTAPVREFADRLGTSLAGFFNASAFADRIDEMLSQPRRRRRPRTLPDIELGHCVAAQKALLARA